MARITDYFRRKTTMKISLDMTLVGPPGSNLDERACKKMCLAIIEAAGDIAVNWAYYVESASGDGFALVERTGPGTTVTHGIPDDTEGKSNV